MAAWFTVVAPLLPDIIKMAKPIFTRTKNPEQAPDLVPQQIVELQDAATKNTGAIRDLAEEMQQTIAALQRASVKLDRKLERANRLALVAVTMALLGFAVAAYALAG